MSLSPAAPRDAAAPVADSKTGRWLSRLVRAACGAAALLIGFARPYEHSDQDAARLARLHVRPNRVRDRR